MRTGRVGQQESHAANLLPVRVDIVIDVQRTRGRNLDWQVQRTTLSDKVCGIVVVFDDSINSEWMGFHDRRDGN
jgi:hypothetical protein